jgi:hypothetical protein
MLKSGIVAREKRWMNSVSYSLFAKCNTIMAEARSWLVERGGRAPFE